MYLTDLPDAVAKSGLPVVQVDGWRTRGHGPMVSVDAVVCHHTATSAKAAGNYPSLTIVRDGRGDLPGPLCNLGLGRDGTVYIVAAGYAYHAGAVRSSWMTNDHSIGIEAEHDGISSWPALLEDAYARLCAALAEHYDLPTARVLGHKEVCAPVGRKTDPNFDMDAFRVQITDLGDDIVTEDDINKIAAKAAELVLASTVDKDGKVTVKQALNQVRNALAKSSDK